MKENSFLRSDLKMIVSVCNRYLIELLRIVFRDTKFSTFYMIHEAVTFATEE